MFFVFHLEISGNSIKDLHPKNKSFMVLVFSIFHFDMSGKYFKDEHPANKPSSE